MCEELGLVALIWYLETFIIFTTYGLKIAGRTVFETNSVAGNEGIQS